MSISGYTRYTWYSNTRNRSNTIIFRFARKWLIFSYNIFVMLFDWTISSKKKKNIVEGRRYFYKRVFFFSRVWNGMVALEKRSLGSIHLLSDMCQINFPFKKLLSNAKSHEKFNLSRKKFLIYKRNIFLYGHFYCALESVYMFTYENLMTNKNNKKHHRFNPHLQSF